MPDRILVLADDLTGALDTAATFVARGFTATLDLAHDHAETAGGEIVVVDTDTRDATPEMAAAAVARAVRPGHTLYKKLDSLLRGHPAAELAAVLGAVPGALVLCAPAFPAAGRTTVDGVPLVHGEPLDRTREWAVEATAPPADLRALFAGLPAVFLYLATVRSGTAALAALLDRSGPAVVVCDAESDTDLAAIVAAGLLLDRSIVWAGSAGLANALAIAVAPAPSVSPLVSGPPSMPSVTDRGLVAVIGSAAPLAREQGAALAHDLGAKQFPVPPDLPEQDAAELALLVRDAARTGGAVVTVEGGVAVAGERLRVLRNLVRVVAPAAAVAGTLVLTGGATARAVLRAGAVRRLRVVAELAPGIVLSTADPDGPVVITKAGSLGDPSTLVRAVRAANGMESTP